MSKTKTVDSDLAHIDPLFPQIKPKITTWRYLWSGDQLIEETPIYADGTLAVSQKIQWLYQPGEITPTALSTGQTALCGHRSPRNPARDIQ
ncbi:hypothetical protein [Proteus sp. G2609]|uniref:hypothetical protein n=1 Tax=Proteus sp. G2609 TaxID=2698840 RepID=UPI001F1DB4A2|nr:hypothetical protein [Proteus sp. G2609]